MGSFGLSDGTRLKNSVIDSRIRKAKSDKLRQMQPEGTDRCCERCGSNQGRLTMSHLISVKEAKESGRSEIAYDIDDMELACEKCHLWVESQTKEEREQLYFKNKIS